MSTILYLEASPRGQRSRSTAAANAFLGAYTAKNPQTKINHKVRGGAPAASR